MNKTNAEIAFSTLTRDESGSEATCIKTICMLSADDLQRALNTSRSQLYINMRTLGMPKPIRFGSRCVRWRAAEIEAWLDTLSESSSEVKGTKDQDRIDGSEAPNE